MGLAQLRFCDLCGGKCEDSTAARLTVPSRRQRQPRTQGVDTGLVLFGGIFSIGESQDVFDVCEGCTKGLLARTAQLREDARRRIEQDVKSAQARVDAAQFAGPID